MVYKMVVSVAALSMFLGFSFLVYGGPPEEPVPSLDELLASPLDGPATIACASKIQHLSIVRALDRSRRDNDFVFSLSQQPEAREAAANLLSSRLVPAQGFPETRVPLPVLEAIAGNNAVPPECRRSVHAALVATYSYNPRIIQAGSKALAPEESLDFAVPEGATWFAIRNYGKGKVEIEIEGQKKELPPPPRRQVSAWESPVTLGQKVKITNVDTVETTLAWGFTEIQNFALRTKDGWARFGIGSRPADLADMVSQTTFELSLARAEAWLNLARSCFQLPADELIETLEGIANGKDFDCGGLGKINGAVEAWRHAIAAGYVVEMLAGAYAGFGYQVWNEQICGVLKDKAENDPNPLIRFAAAKAYFQDILAQTRPAPGVVQNVFILCPEGKVLDQDDFYEHKRKGISDIDVQARLKIALNGRSEEFRAVAAAAVAKALADLDETLFVKALAGLVPAEDLAKLVTELARTKIGAEGLIREKALELLAIRGITPQVRSAGGLALGLIWEEWARTGKSSRITRLTVEGLYRFTIANHSLFSEYATAATAPLARLLSSKEERVVNFGYQITEQFRSIVFGRPDLK